MASLRDIKKRIVSVKNTQKITRAMKLVSAAKLRRAAERVESSRPYAERVQATASGLARRAEELGEAMHPLLTRREHPKVCELVVMTSDRGLCGAFNSNTVRRALRFLIENGDRYEEIRVSTIGKKGMEALRREKVKIRKHYEGVFDATNYKDVSAIAQELSQAYLDGEVDEVYLVYNEFKSAITQILTLKPLLPVEVEPSAGDHLVDFEYEPSRGELLDALLPQHIAVQLYRAVFESVASEHGARMNAMENATANAKEMVGKLSLQYNRARQAAITTELMEIIGGAEALK
ncbi:MAG: ATP synthase F1 subunit gamma [Myxococcota bacterium]